MPAITADDGVRLYTETTGTGAPLLFIHEFAGDHRSWEPQVRFFSGGYRCITYAAGPARVQFQNKNPRGWAEFAAALGQHSALGAALTMRGVQAARPSLYHLQDELAQVRTPVLLVVGDEDEGCLETALMLKRTIGASGLAILPRTGHTANLEEPEVFNWVVDRFLAAVERGAWRPRDPRSRSASTNGIWPSPRPTRTLRPDPATGWLPDSDAASDSLSVKWSPSLSMHVYPGGPRAHHIRGDSGLARATDRADCRGG